MVEAKARPSMLNRGKKLLSFLLKAGLAAVIVGVLFVRNRDSILESFRHFNYAWLVPAALLYFLHMVVCAWRWQVLTRVIHIDLSRAEAFSLTMQGYFFSLVIPGGTIGGDLAKIGVLSARTPPGAKVEGAFSILMDRIVGMIALFLPTIFIVIPVIPVLMRIRIAEFELDTGMKALLIAGLFALCLAGIAASLAVFFHAFFEKIPPVGFLMRKADQWSHGMLRRMTAATDLYRKSWKSVAGCIVWSVPFVHLMTAAVFYCLVAGLGVPAVSPLVIVAAVFIGNIAGLIPISPSGVGIRDLVVVTILAAAGMADADAKTAQLLYTALLLVFNLLGGIFFVLDPGRKKPGRAS